MGCIAGIEFVADFEVESKVEIGAFCLVRSNFKCVGFLLEISKIMI